MTPLERDRLREQCNRSGGLADCLVAALVVKPEDEPPNPSMEELVERVLDIYFRLEAQLMEEVS